MEGSASPYRPPMGGPSQPPAASQRALRAAHRRGTTSCGTPARISRGRRGAGRGRGGGGESRWGTPWWGGGSREIERVGGECVGRRNGKWRDGPGVLDPHDAICTSGRSLQRGLLGGGAAGAGVKKISERWLALGGGGSESRREGSRCSSPATELHAHRPLPSMYASVLAGVQGGDGISAPLAPPALPPRR